MVSSVFTKTLTALSKGSKQNSEHMTYTIGIDVGGTFTDFLLQSGEDGARIYKVISSPDDPSDAVFAGLSEMAADAGQELSAFLSEVRRIVHGTTVTTNAVLTGRTAKTGLLTTHGFRDALQMRRGIREELYNNKYLAPEPIVPRWMRLPIRGRVVHTGLELDPIHLADIDASAAQFEAEGIEAVAVCFMHAYANPSHEQTAADRLQELMPDAYISVSTDILPQVRLYERTSTTVLNAAVGPILQRYLDRLTARLAETGFSGTLLIMQSNGGVCAPEAASAKAASTLLSGPAAGPVAGLAYAGEEKNFITIDMGGTSFEASLVRDGAPAVTTSTTINRFAMALPSMDIKTIGAGGGSIAWIDNGGLLRMGPDSAGAKPGPVCYGLGGEHPTCSDANLVLGYLSADYFAGGRINLNQEAAEAAIDAHVGGPLGLDTLQAAAGMYRVMNANMSSAIREISVERGHDPRDFPLICAGGAGALHAAMIARDLGISKVLVPREASILCAAGMLRTDLRHDLVRSYATPFTVAGIDEDKLLALLADMETEARALLNSEGILPDAQDLYYALDLRYLGQYHEVRVEEVPETLLKSVDTESVQKLFHQAHDRLYGYSLEGEDKLVELVNIRLTAIGRTEKPALPEDTAEDADPETARKGTRPALLPDHAAQSDVSVYDGDKLHHGHEMAGPVLIETAVTTILVPDGFHVTWDAAGTAILSDHEGGPHG